MSIKLNSSRLLTGLAAMVLVLSSAAVDWPAWRGADGSGISADKNYPLKWSTKANVRWRVDLPGPGNSSPIVSGDRVFVSQAVQKDNRRTLMCFDKKSGKLLWQSGVTYTDNEQSQESNPYCSGTPATDGKSVFVCFGSAGVYTYDFEGKELWHRDLGKINHMFGNAVSVLLAGELCVLNYGPDEKARLIALKKSNGQTAWEAEPPKVDPSEQQMPGGPGGGRGPGGGGPGGAGGRGGFGPGMIVASQWISSGDKNGDEKLSKEELLGVADLWFDKLDPEKTGKVSQEDFVTRLGDVLPAPQGGGGPPGGGGGGPGGGRGGFGPGRFVGPGLFTAADVNKDGSLTREELKSTFAKWFSEWDTEKSGALDEAKLRDGLNAALPRPQFGGPGGVPGGRGPGGPGGGGGPGGSWSTPILIKIGSHEELIATFPNRVAAYEPATGKMLWFSKGLGGAIYASPVWSDGTIFAASSGMGGGGAVALKPGGSGEVTESQRLWRQDRFKSSIGSGVAFEGRLYTIGQDGVAGCFDLKTGDKIWEERLQGPGSRTGSWSSMILADGKIYVPNQSGDVFVLRAGPKFELLATNSVNESTNASLAASDGSLFLRTDNGLWCFASAK